MSTDRQLADEIVASAGYKLFAGPVDKTKVEAASKGIRKPSPSNREARVAWELYLRDAPSPVPPQPSVKIPAPFEGRGMFLLEPTGGSENIADLKAAGFTYVLLNLAYVRGGSWDTVRQRCAQLGIDVVPWRRVRRPEDSAQVENTADQWGCRATAHNLETEAVTTYPPRNLGSFVAAWTPRPRAVITEPWAQNNAGWDALAGWVGMPEAFLNADARWQPRTVCDHIAAEGIPRAVPAFGWGAWSDAPVAVPPADYLAAWPGPYAVYFGDSRAPQYREWKR